MSETYPRTCIPVPKIEEDCYDWWKRHESKKAWVKSHRAEVVFFGDSLTHFWSAEDNVNYGGNLWEELFAGKPVLNLGYGYDRIQNVLWRIDHGELENQNPKLFVICIGTNQYSISSNYSGDTPEDTAAGIRFLLEKLRKGFPDAHLAVMALFPRGGKMPEIRSTNRLLSEFVPAMENAELIDITEKYVNPAGEPDPRFFQGDWCHLNRAGYELWAEAVLPVIRKYAGL